MAGSEATSKPANQRRISPCCGFKQRHQGPLPNLRWKMCTVNQANMAMNFNKGPFGSAIQCELRCPLCQTVFKHLHCQETNALVLADKYHYHYHDTTTPMTATMTTDTTLAICNYMLDWEKPRVPLRYRFTMTSLRYKPSLTATFSTTPSTRQMQEAKPSGIFMPP